MKKAVICLGVLLYGLAAWLCGQGKADGNRTYYWLQGELDASQAQEILGEQEEQICFWGEVPSQSLTCRETGGRAWADYLPIQASPGLLDKMGLAWEEGCLIDPATAQALFRTPTPGGQSLYLGERRLKVLGILDIGCPTLVAVGTEEDGAVLNRCLLDCPREAARGETFLIRSGLRGVEADYFTPWTLAHNWLILLPLGLVLAFLARCWRRLRQDWRKASLGLLLGLGAVWILLGQLVIPREILPQKWSDFSFWGRMLQSQKENFQLLLLKPMSPRHLRMIHSVVQSILSSTAAALAALWTVGRKNDANSAD